MDTQRKILTDTLVNYRQALDLTTTLYKTGINSEQEVVQAQTQLNIATAQATDLGVSRAQFEHAIATLIGKPASNFTLPAAPFASQSSHGTGRCSRRYCSSGGPTSRRWNAKWRRRMP